MGHRAQISDLATCSRSRRISSPYSDAAEGRAPSASSFQAFIIKVYVQRPRLDYSDRTAGTETKTFNEARNTLYNLCNRYIKTSLTSTLFDSKTQIYNSAPWIFQRAAQLGYQQFTAVVGVIDSDWYREIKVSQAV